MQTLGQFFEPLYDIPVSIDTTGLNYQNICYSYILHTTSRYYILLVVDIRCIYNGSRYSVLKSGCWTEKRLATELNRQQLQPDCGCSPRVSMISLVVVALAQAKIKDRS